MSMSIPELGTGSASAAALGHDRHTAVVLTGCPTRDGL